MVETDYLDCLFPNSALEDTIKLIVSKCRRAVKQYNKNLKRPVGSFGLVGQGLSGALVIPSVALKIDFPFAIVRKDSDSSHSSCPVEGDLSFSHYIFVDDFIESGCSFWNVNDNMLRLKIKPAAIVLYDEEVLEDNELECVLDHVDPNSCKHNLKNIKAINKLIYL